MADLIEYWVSQHSGSFVAIIILCLTSVVQISPIKVNPWSLAVKMLKKIINKLFNSDVLVELKLLNEKLDGTKTKLDEHIRVDDERDADMHRYRLLRFNTELLRKIRHTKEEFDEILYSINCYERYCADHPKYKNNRAVLAIENIKRVYKDCMETNDFLL